ncbi:MAG: RNA polymerase sigma factor [Paludibacter sp.]|nr:RNA polymerase sigma factor [Paludibacter sp.]
MDVTHKEILTIFPKLKKGDEEAFSFFYRFFINDMYAYGRSLGVEDDHVMDAIQDVFLKIFFNKPRFESVEHLKFFLLKSLKNKLYDHYKRKQLSFMMETQGDGLNFSIKTTVLDEIIKEEDRIVVQQKVEKLLNSLSPIQREAVYLRYIQELEYAQISEIMNKKETSVRKLVSQAINKIRKENNTLLSLTFISLLFSRF